MGAGMDTQKSLIWMVMKTNGYQSHFFMTKGPDMFAFIGYLHCTANLLQERYLDAQNHE